MPNEQERSLFPIAWHFARVNKFIPGTKASYTSIPRQWVGWGTLLKFMKFDIPNVSLLRNLDWPA